MWGSIIEFLNEMWNLKISINEIVTPLANYKFSPLPILAMYLVFDSTALIRRITKRAYVPMYFIFFPTGHSDRLYAEYLGEDDLLSGRQRPGPAKQRWLRKRLVLTAIISMLFATVVAPYLTGFVAALFLTPQQFNEFLVFLLIAKAILIVNALRTLRNESLVGWEDNTFVWVLAMYGVYLLFVFYGLTEAFDWTSANIRSYSLGDLIAAAFRALFVNIVVGIAFSSLATWAVMEKFREAVDKQYND